MTERKGKLIREKDSRVVAWALYGAATAVILERAGDVLKPANLLTALKKLPGVRGHIQSKRARVIQQLEDEATKSELDVPLQIELPEEGIGEEALEEALELRAKRDWEAENASSRMSGTIYLPPGERCDQLSRAYAKFAHTNPLHSDSFPSVARMERETVAMTISILNGSTDCCGCLTSGGTESIFSAVLAARESFQGVGKPNIVACETAHAALYKACKLLRIDLRIVKADSEGKMTAGAAKARANGCTILFYCSAPSYPHGSVDDVEGIAHLARARGALCHVDACLGGFVLPYWYEQGVAILGKRPSKIDFSVEGVTSVSVDLHKYGVAQKGSSVIAYWSPELRKRQFSAVPSWPGGLYASPGFPGSRSGGLIAQAWAALASMGNKGYRQQAIAVRSAAERLATRIDGSERLDILGAPSVVVAFRPKPSLCGPFELNDRLVSRGWLLNPLQRPDGLHFCVTPVHSPELMDELADVLEEEVDRLAQSSSGASADGGRAPIYGMASSLPDRDLVKDLLVDAQDVLLRHS